MVFANLYWTIESMENEKIENYADLGNSEETKIGSTNKKKGKCC